MRIVQKTTFSAVALVLAIGMAACGEPSTTSKVSSKSGKTTCVEIPEGAYFRVEDGRLAPVSAAAIQGSNRRVHQGATGWVSDVQEVFAERGFPWMELRVREGVATLTGVAPDVDAKERAFLAGEQAVLTQARDEISIIVDGISIEGGDAGVGSGLATLSQSALSVERCQRAFTETMQGRHVNFRTSSAAIRPDSARLLDAVTGVAILCKAHAIEIGGHTDARGSDDLNLELSQQRADAVRDYLTERGVPDEALNAIGYGETRPIDPGSTQEAYSVNRRTQFTVSQR